MLLRENHLFGCSWLKPSQASVSVGLALAADFGFCFQCKGGSSLVLRRPIEIAAFIGTQKRFLPTLASSVILTIAVDRRV
jgi:hypothetical protein